jgi:aminoglycoside 6'-N-acetyltransferase
VSDLPTPTLDGAVVHLRPATLDDVDALVAIRQQPEVFEHWRGGHDLHAAVLEDFAEDDVRHCVIELDGRVVGWIQWEVELEPDYRSAGIDLYLDPAVRGRGLGADAIRAVARFLFEEEGHHRITIDPAAHNEAAIRCYTKVGFRPVGILRQAERGNDGTWHDSLMMDLLRDELTAG